MDVLPFAPGLVTDTRQRLRFPVFDAAGGGRVSTWAGLCSASDQQLAGAKMRRLLYPTGGESCAGALESQLSIVGDSVLRTGVWLPAN